MKKTERIPIRATKLQKEAIKVMAKFLKMTVTEYICYRTLENYSDNLKELLTLRKSEEDKAALDEIIEKLTNVLLSDNELIDGIQIRVTLDDKKKFEALAKASGKTITEYIYSKIFITNENLKDLLKLRLQHVNNQEKSELEDKIVTLDDIIINLIDIKS